MLLKQILTDRAVAIAPETHRHARQGWLNCDCPYCGKGTGKFHMGLSGRTATCWRCGKHDFIKTIAEITGLTWFQTKELLGDETTISTTQKVRPQGRLVLPKKLGSLGPQHLRYLLSRGFSRAAISHWSLGGLGFDAGFLSWRIFIPITYRGVVVSWTTRAIGKEVEPRYLSAKPEEEAVSAKELLFGEDLAGHAIIICEGPLDAIRVGPGCVATMGVSVSKAQITKMASHPMRIICMDAEDQAQQRARALADLLAPYPGTTINVVLDSGKDPAAANERELELLRGMLE